MKILYVIPRPNTMSETYIATEIKFVQQKGHEVFILCKDGNEFSRIPNPVPDERMITYKDGEEGAAPLREAFGRWGPDVIHVHWLTVAQKFAAGLMEMPRPVTIRAHSFDFTVERVKELLQIPAIKKIWMFPHFATRFDQAPDDERIEPMTVTFDDKVFTSADVRRDRPLHVVRSAAGVKGKNLSGFFEVARLLPDVPFTLITTRSPACPTYPDELMSEKPDNVDYKIGLLPSEVRDVLDSASVYLSGFDPNSHPYGMPVSIAEAMAMGLFILAPDTRGVSQYIADCGTLYDGVDAVASLISDMLPPEDVWWAIARSRSIRRSWDFGTQKVLPRLIDAWYNL